MMQQMAKEVTSVRQLVQRRKRRQRQKQATLLSGTSERRVLPLVVKGAVRREQGGGEASDGSDVGKGFQMAVIGMGRGRDLRW